MATLEQLHSILARRLPPPREQHVFAADDGRRARVVRLACLGTAALALVWLAALAVAMLGAERLPGVSLPSVEQIHRVSDAAIRQRSPLVQSSAARPAARMAAPRLGRSEPQRLNAQTPPVQRAAPTSAIVSSPAAVPSPAAPPAPLTPDPGQSPPPQQGWARRGWTTPPGQAKQNESVPRGHPRRTGTPTIPSTTATSGQGATHSPKKG